MDGFLYATSYSFNVVVSDLAAHSQSWFIGRVSANGVMPSTPNSSVAPTANNSVNLEDNNPSQVSPMSSAFPPVQSRSTTTVV